MGSDLLKEHHKWNREMQVNTDIFLLKAAHQGANVEKNTPERVYIFDRNLWKDTEVKLSHFFFSVNRL